MTPGKSTIEQLFNGTRVFEIPFYQRSYVWDVEQWERMLNDMVSVGHQTTDYFLGAIILKQVITSTSKRGDYKIERNCSHMSSSFLFCPHFEQFMPFWYVESRYDTSS